jgi:hypothetical protein
LTVVVLLGACSNIIGISSYEIDPSLDPSAQAGDGSGDTGAGGDTGGSVNGGKDSGGSVTGGSVSGGQANGGSDAGQPGGGSTPIAGDSPGGQTGVAGDGNPVGCTSAAECDDAIDCTTDACGGNGVCTHTPKDSLCDGDLCEKCSPGIGCEAGPKTSTQLLLDPNFDDMAGDWSETSDTFGKNIFADAAAQTMGNVAKFGPAKVSAAAQEYGDLLQIVTVPTGTVSITLTGYYKLTPGTKMLADDYVAVGFWEIDGGIMPFAQFHSFQGAAGAQATWKAFTYTLPKAKVTTMGGNDYTFDLVANVWGSVFRFDTLAVTAVVCE